MLSERTPSIALSANRTCASMPAAVPEKRGRFFDVDVEEIMPARTLAAKRSSPESTAQASGRAVFYARVSSKEQEKEGYSIQAQLRLLRDYATVHRLVIAQEFVDVDTAKVSGRG